MGHGGRWMVKKVILRDGCGGKRKWLLYIFKKRNNVIKIEEKKWIVNEKLRKT